jgi:hypothetical protein
MARRQTGHGAAQECCADKGSAAGTDGSLSTGSSTQSWLGPQRSPDRRNATLRRRLTFYGYPRHNDLQIDFGGLLITIIILMHLLEGTNRARLAPGSIRRDGELLEQTG